MSQSDLAARIGLERTALVRIESGERKVSATELVAVAGALDRPVDWFFAEPPAGTSARMPCTRSWPLTQAALSHGTAR